MTQLTSTLPNFRLDFNVFWAYMYGFDFGEYPHYSIYKKLVKDAKYVACHCLHFMKGIS